MQVNSFTMRDLREEVRNGIGIDKYVLKLWDQAYPTKQSRKKLAAANRQRIRHDFIRAWQIFFNTFQQPDQPGGMDAIIKDKQGKAESAWRRLNKGESFSKVAEDMSEDMMSRSSGGDLGFIGRSSYGDQFDKAVRTLKPGVYSKPVQSTWGFHIIKWRPVSDDEVLLINKVDFASSKTTQTMDQIQKRAKVVRLHKSKLAGINPDEIE
jgi:parvulin-like peptidyl-prolyl isomerase